MTKRFQRFTVFSQNLSLALKDLSCDYKLRVHRLVKRWQQIWLNLANLIWEALRLAGTLIRWGALTLVLAVITFPYQVWRVFVPDHTGSQPVSRFFRKTFESKRVKQVLGANLAALVLASSVLQPALAMDIRPLEAEEIEMLPEPKEVLTTETTFRQPVGGYISQVYHWYHPGIDIAGNDNQIIYPIAQGTVAVVEYDRFGYGNSVIVTHGNKIVSRYAHLSKVKVQTGESVDKNSALGYVGSTGWSTGPHLHLEIYQEGQTINPLTVVPDYSQE
jgi:hypothetical protein